MTAATILAAGFLISQFPGLSYPVLAIDTTAKSFQAFGNSIDFVFTHFGDLLEAKNAHFIERLLNGRTNSLDVLQGVPRAINCIIVP